MLNSFLHLRFVSYPHWCHSKTSCRIAKQQCLNFRKTHPCTKLFSVTFLSNKLLSLYEFIYIFALSVFVFFHSFFDCKRKCIYGVSCFWAVLTIPSDMVFEEHFSYAFYKNRLQRFFPYVCIFLETNYLPMIWNSFDCPCSLTFLFVLFLIPRL